MEYRNNNLLVIFVGLACLAAVESQLHPCQESPNNVIYNRRCFWFSTGASVDYDGAVSACQASAATPSNIYSQNHLDAIMELGSRVDVAPQNIYTAYIGMEWSPEDKALSNYDGTSANLPSTVWAFNHPMDFNGLNQPQRRTTLSIWANDPTTNLAGMQTTIPDGFWPAVVCETEQLFCTTPVTDSDTQGLSCPEETFQCTVTCMTGYAYADGTSSDVLTCQEDLTWDKDVMPCQVVTCPSLNFDGQQGNMICNGAEYGRECSFFCDSHKELKGPRTRVCQADGTWSEMQPTCEDIVCEPIVFPADQGTMQCTYGWNYASECSFYCKSGLQRWGSMKVTCLWNGEWSDEQPTCKEFDPECPDVDKHDSSCPDTNCAVNADCNDSDEICCPTECGSAVCWEKPKRVIPRELLLLLFLGGFGNRRPTGNRCATTNCLVNACQVTSCPSNLGAQCRTTCNGCQANFVDFNRDITRLCRCPQRYPPFQGCSQQQCSRYRCVTNNQPSYYDPNIQCRMSSCGGCFPQFYNRFGRRINCRQILQYAATQGILVDPVAG